MNKRGIFYVFLACVIMVLFLIGAYIKLVKFYNQVDDAGVTKNIGGKQASILQAIREGERVQLFVQEATRMATKSASSRVDCGEPYLGRRMIGGAACERVLVNTAFDEEFTSALASYPGPAITDIVWEKEKGADGNTMVLYGTKRIPVGTETVPQTESFSGVYTDWPTDDKRVSSMFGKRNIGHGSTNHPGMDLTVSGVGAPIKSLGGGMAQYKYDSSGNQEHYVKVTQDNGLVVYYIHTRPVSSAVAGSIVVPSDNPVRVEQGQVIAEAAPYKYGAHLHLQIQVQGITARTMKDIFPGHTSASDDQPDLKSYAVTKDDAAFLDPICFFDRNTMAGALTKAQLAGNPYESCDAYANKLNLARRIDSAPVQLAIPVEEETPKAEGSVPEQITAAQVKAAADNVDAGALTGEERAKFARTQQNIQPYLRLVKDVSDSENTDYRLVLAVITQESEGIATGPQAVSNTGAAGIAQFTGDTASKSFGKIFKNVQPCCTGAEAEAGVCRSPPKPCPSCAANRPPPPRCNWDQAKGPVDDRFIPEKSIRAEAQYLRDIYKKYKGKEQAIAFTAAAYNGGDAAVNRAIAATGNPDPTWEEVKAKILADTSITPYPKKGQEIAGYGDRIIKFYTAWGGHTLAGTSYSETQLGYYDLKLRVPTQLPDEFQTAVQEMSARIAKCTDMDCVEQGLHEVAGSHSMNIRPEPLQAGAGCMDQNERALAYVENQFEQCKASPDFVCSCPLGNSVDAEIDISDKKATITKLDDKPIEKLTMDGLAYPKLGGDDDESTQRFKVTYYHDGEFSSDWTGTLKVKGSVLTVDGDDYKFAGLYKPTERLGLAFTEAEGEQCVMPPAPVAYCLQKADWPDAKVVFYVDTRFKTSPQAALTLQDATPVEGTSLVRLNITSDHDYPYFYVSFPPDKDGNVPEEYLRIEDTDVLQIKIKEPQQVARAQQKQYKALRLGNEYILVLPSNWKSIALLDSNLRKTQAITQ